MKREMKGLRLKGSTHTHTHALSNTQRTLRHASQSLHGVVNHRILLSKEKLSAQTRTHSPINHGSFDGEGDEADGVCVCTCVFLRTDRQAALPEHMGIWVTTSFCKSLFFCRSRMFNKLMFSAKASDESCVMNQCGFWELFVLTLSYGEHQKRVAQNQITCF